MPTPAQFIDRHLRHMIVAWLVLVASLAPTGFAWWWMRGYVERHKAEAWLPWFVLSGGIGISILLFCLVWVQGRRQRDAELANEALQRRDKEFVALNEDLERRIAERTGQLRAANLDLLRFKAIAEATTDFVNICALDGQVLFLNRGARRMAGIGDDEEAGKFFIKDFSPPWVLELFQREGFPAAFREGSWTSEIALLHRDGHEIPVSFVGLVIRSASGQPEYLACVARDMSDQRRVTEQLEKALAEERELNLLKSNFISMVSHEIRTPLALILGSSEILSRYLDRLSPEKRTSHLQTIESAVQRMGALVDDVLLFSRAEAGRMEFHPEAIDLKVFCPQLVDEITSATSQRCPVDLALVDISQPARGDENLLRHILVNLLGNAAKYSHPGTPVTFLVSQDCGDAVFIVQDRGMGIPKDDRKRLFTPFYRGKNVVTIQGTGLGLVIVKHCVERHGGTIEVASVENAGTTVTVRLPLFSPAHTDFIKRISNPQAP